MKCIDVHLYYGGFGFPGPAPKIKEVVAFMERAEVEKAIMMSSRGIQYDFVVGNAELAEVIAPYPHLFGYVYINMHYPELSLLEMEKYLETDKFVGVKYNGEYNRAAASAPENREVFDLLEKRYAKPLLLHTWGLAEHGNAMPYSLPAQALDLARQHPDLKIVMGHMGGPEWPSAIRACMQAPNLFTDMQSSYADRDKVGVAVRALGAHKVLFGSGNVGSSLMMQKGAVMDADITDEERHTVFYETARRVFGI
jgi:predicted TIM-barrel fold metal-dependent hydrolase